MSIAVVMSVYKKEKPEYLDLAMKSIWIDQTLKPTEVIIVEDGMLTTDLYDVLDKWKQEIGNKYICLKNEVNIGLTKSLNICLKKVTSKYVARMDSDDICLPFRFEKQYNYLEKNKDIGILGCNIQEIDEDNVYTKLRYYPLQPNEIIEYIPKATPLQHSAVMMRNEIFDNGLKYNENYIMTQDLALWFDAIENGVNIANLPEILLLFRITKDTFSRRNKSKAIHEFKIYMKGIYRLNGFSLKYIYPISRLIMRFLPSSFIKFIYDSRLRKMVLKNK
jgi:glycosyltransferase involved in cell wall biosynthesis